MNIELPDFSKLHMLVIGDVMIDRYISGAVKRISPEAPVPVVEFQSVENRLGGAANVALNIHALGATISLVSIIGDDSDGKSLVAMLDDLPSLNNHTMALSTRRTTVKTRVMSGNQHLLRIDHEDTFDVDIEESKSILNTVADIISNHKIDGIILQDYNKGLMTINLIAGILQLAKDYKIDTFVDPKEKNFFAFKGCTLFKPNKKEVLKAVGISDLLLVDEELRRRLGHEITFITLGQDGLYINDGKTGMTLPTKPRIISDVCGAGDSVISIVSLCYVSGMSMEDIAHVANTAGGQVCEKPGVVSIDLLELKSELKT